VRIAAVTGQERDGFDGPLDASGLIGQEASVEGASPTATQDGWICHVWVESQNDLVSFPEAALEPTGEIKVVGDEESVQRVRHDATTDRPWRDDVLLDLVTTARDIGEAQAIARLVADALTAVDGVDAVESRISRLPGDPVRVTLWVRCAGDALEVFGRIIDLAGGGAPPDETDRRYVSSWFDGPWEHSDDESEFISSRWIRTDGPQFLAPDVREADVAYRRWTSPRRRSRDEIARDRSPSP
jgi:hypothetical protein